MDAETTHHRTPLKGAGAVAKLCAGAVFNLKHEVRFTAAKQVVVTQGRPTGDARALLKVTGAALGSISLACGNSVVAGNTITNATDGAIVVFGAPGSKVRNNTIVATERVLLGGINLVDFEPVDGNYEGTVVGGNTIDARSALIKVGVAMGPPVWSCNTKVNDGATVTGNTLTGAHMGYGFAVHGVRNWKVTGNVDRSTHVGVPSGSCGGKTVSAAAGFQVGSAVRHRR